MKLHVAAEYPSPHPPLRFSWEFAVAYHSFWFHLFIPSYIFHHQNKAKQFWKVNLRKWWSRWYPLFWTRFKQQICNCKFGGTQRNLSLSRRRRWSRFLLPSDGSRERHQRSFQVRVLTVVDYRAGWTRAFIIHMSCLHWWHDWNTTFLLVKCKTKHG